jgi:hypothetical protein
MHLQGSGVYRRPCALPGSHLCAQTRWLFPTGRAHNGVPTSQARSGILNVRQSPVGIPGRSSISYPSRRFHLLRTPAQPSPHRSKGDGHIALVDREVELGMERVTHQNAQRQGHTGNMVWCAGLRWQSSWQSSWLDASDATHPRQFASLGFSPGL